MSDLAQDLDAIGDDRYSESNGAGSSAPVSHSRMPQTARSGRRLAGSALFWLLLLLAAYFIPRGLLANPDSHLALSYALVERHTVRIDAYVRLNPTHQDLLDKAIYCGSHTDVRTCTHFYSDKAPGISILTALAYAPLRPVLPKAMLPEGKSVFLLRTLLTLVVISLPCAAFAVTYWQFLSRFVAPGTAMVVTIGYAIGSMALPFSTLLFSHALTAALLFWAFILLFTARHGTSAPYTASSPTMLPVRPLVAGILAGYAIGCEYPTAIIAVLIGLYALVGNRLQVALLYSLGGCLGLLPTLIYNMAAFGSPTAQGYAHLAGDSQYARGMAHGLLGVGLPTWSAIWGTTFSPYRGIFWLSPWLLLAAPGLWLMSRTEWRVEAWFCGAISLVYFLFQAGYIFWDGGASVGPRHFLPALPFVVFPVAFALSKPSVKRLAIVLIAVSSLVLLLVLATNPLFGDPKYVAHVRNPLVDQTLHDLAIGRLQNNWGKLFQLPGITSLLPLVIGIALLGRRMRRGLAAQAKNDLV